RRTGGGVSPVSTSLAAAGNRGPPRRRTRRMKTVPDAPDVPASLEDARARHDELARAVRDARYRYYVLSDPPVTDAEFDALFQELLALEEPYPALVTASSPTQQVGAPVDTAFPPARHPQPMLSLDNAF